LRFGRAAGTTFFPLVFLAVVDLGALAGAFPAGAFPAVWEGIVCQSVQAKKGVSKKDVLGSDVCLWRRRAMREQKLKTEMGDGLWVVGLAIGAWMKFRITGSHCPTLRKSSRCAPLTEDEDCLNGNHARSANFAPFFRINFLTDSDEALQHQQPCLNIPSLLSLTTVFAGVGSVQHIPANTPTHKIPTPSKKSKKPFNFPGPTANFGRPGDRRRNIHGCAQMMRSRRKSGLGMKLDSHAVTG
jgi:hypothetical protein